MEGRQQVYTFSGGPGVLPQEVLVEAQRDLLNWNGRGISVMELSHRSQDFFDMAEKAEADFRKFMEVPKDY